MSTSTTSTPTRDAELGTTFRAARHGAGISLRKLCERAEVDFSHVSRWERGQRAISESTYQHITLALADYVAGRWSA